MSVNRNELLQHLANHQCYLHRHGSKHDIYQNSLKKRKQRSHFIQNWKGFFAILSANN